MLEKISEDFGKWAKKNKQIIVTAESCTAGLLSSTIAMTPSSSSWLDSGFVVYTPNSKFEMLGVSLETIDKFNITSEEVAREMASGALSLSDANLAMSVTGVAGPSGGTDEIPVGTICMAWFWMNDYSIFKKSETKLFSGSRNDIREQIVVHMLSQAMILNINNLSK